MTTAAPIDVSVFENLCAADLEPTTDFAARMDAADPLARFRDRFLVPSSPDGRSVAYFVGNSLGLQPREARGLVEDVLDDWATLGVDGHFDAKRPWYPYHENLREGLAHVVGARPHEVVAMNSLTVNLHLLLMSFHRPAGDRRIVLMEDGAFPSDTYAVTSHVAARGGDPDHDVVRLAPRAGEDLLRTEDIVAEIQRLGDRLSTVMLGGVNFRTGQLLDMAAITAAGHAAGATVGFDLAHAAGNVSLALHDWNVDYAAWCSYKYLNGGPGAIAGAFVHERHAANLDLPRFAGWWGNDPDTRFRMHLEDRFVPVASADAWQLSNPPILAMAPLVASLALFSEAGMTALRAKSRALTGFLHVCLQDALPDDAEIVTPSNAEARGCQLSVRLAGDARARFERLAPRGVVADFRPPDLVRLAPVPLYSTFADCLRAADALRDA
jgi:kynureninase